MRQPPAKARESVENRQETTITAEIPRPAGSSPKIPGWNRPVHHNYRVTARHFQAAARNRFKPLWRKLWERPPINRLYSPNMYQSNPKYRYQTAAGYIRHGDTPPRFCPLSLLSLFNSPG
ncbi:hypothetical protein DCCM_3587 [Desulfocucumis palustris]|uniref:Uncharacterized protein n=1 Tax=Desulfocucumis palustris TaxID=1898651 RepID=A0A2L2XDN1_9FIRM|nr:hypothetical protein DCCM_3587 [Desulfocucumis palustris]